MDKFKNYLLRQNLSQNTISAYMVAVKKFNSICEDISKKNLLVYKSYLIENYQPKSVNLKIQAVNRYLEYLKKMILK